MNISWVVGSQCLLDPAIDIQQLKNVGPIWGSWKTWRGYATDNVICYTADRAHDMIQHEFHRRCNLYVPSRFYVMLDRPSGVRLYEGEFKQEIFDPEDLIALQLAASQSDIVLVMGFDWTNRELSTDRLTAHKTLNYRNWIANTVRDSAPAQWVLVDHADNLFENLQKLDNLTTDSLANVLAMFK